MIPHVLHLRIFTAMCLCIFLSPTPVESKPSASGMCLPPQAGLDLSRFLEKPQILSIVPSGWHLKEHLKDTKIQQWKIVFFFEPEGTLELLPKEDFPALPHGRWFAYNIEKTAQNGLNEKTRSELLAFAKAIDDAFALTPFTSCSKPSVNDSARQYKELTWPPWLYLILGLVWIILFPLAMLTSLKHRAE